MWIAQITNKYNYLYLKVLIIYTILIINYKLNSSLCTKQMTFTLLSLTSLLLLDYTWEFI